MDARLEADARLVSAPRPWVSAGAGMKRWVVQFGSRVVSFLSEDLIGGRFPLSYGRDWAG